MGRSPSPARRRDERRRDDRRDRDRDRDRRRPRTRSRSRSLERRRRSPERRRSPSPRRRRSLSLTPSSSFVPKAKKTFGERPIVTPAELEGKTPEEQEMLKIMGFCGFDTTKAPRTTSTGGTTNILPPLEFHRAHGMYVSVSGDGYTATMTPISHAVAFSARPVRVNEKVYIRFVEILNRNNTVIRFGFTSRDPATFEHEQAYYRNQNWSKQLAKRFFKKDNIVYYYVNLAGIVHFGVNEAEKGLFFCGVDTLRPLWIVVDVSGTCTVQLVYPRAQMQMSSSLSVEESLPPLRYAKPLEPLSLHITKGRNVQFVNDRGVAARTEGEPCQGYVFTERPMRLGQTIVVQILSTVAGYASSLAFGLTSCDPATLRPCDLPDDAESLMDRPEYWVVKRDAANELSRGDELAVTLTLNGEVIVRRNGSTPVTVMHVDHTVRLWAFVDIHGATQKVRMLSSQAMQAQTPTANDSVNEQAQIPNGHAEPLRIPKIIPNGPSTSRQPPPINSVIGEGTGNLTDTDCLICFENPKDTVLYMCGHVCLCYKCAVKQWKRKGGGRCPVCRAKIKDVIRTYKS